jgi:hypothetical protein
MSELPLPSDPGTDERRDRILDIIVDHPRLWGILALVSLATTFSPKVSTGAMWVFLVVAEILAVFWITGFVRKTRANNGWILLVGVLVGAALFAYGYWLGAPVKERSGQSLLEIVDIQGVSLQKKDTKQTGFFLNVFYANKGGIAVSAMTHRAIYVASPQPLSAAEIVRYAKQAGDVAAPSSRNDGNEIQPGLLPKHFFTIPQDDNEAIQLKSLANDVTSGKAKLYLFVTMKYFDSSLPADQVRVTEFCGMFERTFDLWHNCGTKTYASTKEP